MSTQVGIPGTEPNTSFGALKQVEAGELNVGCVIVPYLRGYGTTTFRSNDTLRNGQQSVVALDAIALMDALQVEQAVVAGFDWGARTAGYERYGATLHGPSISVPTITLEGDANGAPYSDTSAYANKLSRRYETGSSTVASGTTCGTSLSIT